METHEKIGFYRLKNNDVFLETDDKILIQLLKKVGKLEDMDKLLNIHFEN